MAVVFFYPTAKMVSLLTGRSNEYLTLDNYPLHVRQVFVREDVPFALQSFTPHSAIKRLFSKSLRFRAERIFTRDEKIELYLNTLNFGAGVIGLDEASRYYFQKPVSTIDVNESITLASLYQIFRN